MSKPEIGDYDFDILLKELEKLEEENPEFASENSPTKRVGGDITKNFGQGIAVFPISVFPACFVSISLVKFPAKIILLYILISLSI